MSDVIEKTIAVLPNLLTAAITGRPELLHENVASAYFQSFMKACKGLKSKAV